MNDKDTIVSKSQLVDFFRQKEKKKNDWLIGTEHEKFLFNLTTCKPVNISGPEPNLDSIFQKLKANNWNEVKENGVTIGFKKEKLKSFKIKTASLNVNLSFCSTE